MNLYEDNKEADIKYFFYKIIVNSSGTKITLASVTENIDETFDKPETLKAFFQKNKSMSFFFEKEEEVFYKED